MKSLECIKKYLTINTADKVIIALLRITAIFTAILAGNMLAHQNGQFVIMLFWTVALTVMAW